MLNVVAAFAVAPLGGALLAAIVGFVLVLLADTGEMMGRVVGSAFLLTAAFGYAAAIVLGIPGFLLFRRMRWIRRAHWVLLCAAVGGIVGAAVPAAGVLLTGGEYERLWEAAGIFLIAGAVFGVASGLLFARTIKIKPPDADEIAATFE